MNQKRREKIRVKEKEMKKRNRRWRKDEDGENQRVKKGSNHETHYFLTPFILKTRNMNTIF